MTKTGAAARPQFDLEPESLADTLQQYQKQIIIGVIVVAAAVGGIWMWRRSVDIRETRAAEAFAAAENAFAGGNPALAQPELERVLTRYPGTTAGAQSAMLLAQVLYGQQKYADGVAKLEASLGAAPAPLKPAMLALMAGGHEGAGQPVEAAKRFEEAATATEFELERDQHRMAAARNHVAAGNIAGARTIYESIATREDAQHAGEANVRLGELVGK